jgi:hypothetical protein
VLLALAEAEALRGALHVHQERSAAASLGVGGLGGASGGGEDGGTLDALVALHTHTELLDAVNYAPAGGIGGSYEREVVRQAFRFLSSETEYTARDQHLLLRCLRTTDPKGRQDFFTEVRGCRRRVQGGWERTDVAAVLSEPDEFALFEHRALLAATQRRITARVRSDCAPHHPCLRAQRTAPQRNASHRATPRHTAPHRATPRHTAPHRTAPRWTVAARVTRTVPFRRARACRASPCAKPSMPSTRRARAT